MKKLRPVLVWLAVWQLGSMALDQPILLPSPIAALSRLLALSVTGAFWRTIAWSSGRILGGFLIAGALAVGCAVLSAQSGVIRALLAPLTAAVKAAPVASFIILALAWVSPRNLSMLISGLMVFPGIYQNVLEGIRQTGVQCVQVLEMSRVFQVPVIRIVRAIYLPSVLPYFRTACSLALGMCWKAGTAAEVIGLPRGSLGEQLYNAKIYLQTADLFAWTAVIVCISVVFERLFLRLLDAAARWIGGVAHDTAAR